MAIKNERHKKLTKKQAFLAAYAECGNITRACELSETARTSHYEWMGKDEAYREAFAIADQHAAERLEQEARRRAIEGVDEPVFYQGMPVGAVRKYSDTLLIFLLKGALPDKYKDRVAQETTGKIQHAISLEGLSEDEINERIEAELAKIADLQARTGTPPEV